VVAVGVVLVLVGAVGAQVVDVTDGVVVVGLVAVVDVAVVLVGVVVVSVVDVAVVLVSVVVVSVVDAVLVGVVVPVGDVVLVVGVDSVALELSGDSVVPIVVTNPPTGAAVPSDTNWADATSPDGPTRGEGIVQLVGDR
jgi:hypothetical protein